MRNKILKNRGMLLENLIERTSIYCDEKGFYIEKRNLPIKILRKENKYIKGKIIGLATIDYFGFKDGKYFEIEAKQTEDNYFKKSNLRKEQIE
jgi:recombination protein U